MVSSLSDDGVYTIQTERQGLKTPAILEGLAISSSTFRQNALPFKRPVDPRRGPAADRIAPGFEAS